MPIKRNLDNLISNMTNNVNGQQATTNYEIEGLFKPTYNKEGKFEITMRFLPPVAEEDSQFIENRDHWLKQSNGKSLAVTCRKRFKGSDGKSLPCPICEYNQKMYEKYKDIKGAYGQHKLATARPEYMCNILIVRNDNQPSTEGQVFRFKYSKQIKEFIDKAINGNGETDENGEVLPGINPYSYYGPNDADVISGEVRAGANFVWKAVKTDNGPNYEDSHFNKPSRISRCVDGVNSQGQPCKKFVPLTDEEIDTLIEAKLYTLKEHELTVDKVKSYDQVIDYVKTKCAIDLRLTLGGVSKSAEEEYVSTTINKTINTVEADDDEMFSGTPLETPKFESTAPAAPKPTPAPAAPAAPMHVDNDDIFALMDDL